MTKRKKVVVFGPILVFLVFILALSLWLENPIKFNNKDSGVVGELKPQVLGTFSQSKIWPSAQTAIALWMNANRYGTQAPINKSYILNFWASHYDFLLDGQPYDELKALNSNINNMASDSLSYRAMYTRPESSLGENYWGKMSDLKNWVTAHWQEYSWASEFANADDAFEDCFVHVNQDVAAKFSQTTESYIITAYDPQNPKPSRLAGPWDIDSDWVMNVGSPVYISFWRDYEIRQLGGKAVEGVFLDSTGSGWIHLWIGPTKTLEYNINDDDIASRATFTNDIRNLTAALQADLHSIYPEKKLAINNYNRFETNVSPAMLDFQNEADIFWREDGIKENRNSTDMKNEIEAVIRATEAGKIVIMDHSVDLCNAYCTSAEPWNNSTCLTCVSRDRIAGLAAYYQARNENVYYAPISDWFFSKFPRYQEDPAIYAWFNAMSYDIGQPEGSYQYNWAVGQDPSQPNLTYYVFARPFSKALVLFKAKPAGSPVYGVYGDNTATTHQLADTYRPLNADGTLGNPTTSITLRNWEGAILIKQDNIAPRAINDLSISTGSTNSVSLTWTVPGDDNSNGQASSYDVRYLSSAITSENFSQATQVFNVSNPQVAGTRQNFEVTGLSPDTVYYFAIKTADEIPNWSVISNIVNRKTSAYTCIHQWSCGDWSTCQNSGQTRTCTDSNNCGTIVNKPPTQQVCTVNIDEPTSTPDSCQENWSCGDWSTCQDSIMTRVCSDLNNCLTTNNKPELLKFCVLDSNTFTHSTPPVINYTLTNRLKGMILLQVEEHGEAWYVRPDTGKRLYLKDGTVAYSLMRNLSLGISNADLAKIPIGFEERFECLDSDRDGLGDKLEDGLGTDKYKADTDGDGYNDGTEVKNNYNPLGPGKLDYNYTLANRLKGQILLQVQAHGEAWYLNPADGQRYYMPDGPSAYQIMRYLSLGITNSDLDKIEVE